MRSRVLCAAIAVVAVVGIFLLGRLSVGWSGSNGHTDRQPVGVENILPRNLAAAEQAAERAAWEEAAEHYRRAVGQLLLDISHALAGEFESTKTAAHTEQALAVSDKAISLLSGWGEYGYYDHQANVQDWVFRKARLVAQQRGSSWETVMGDWSQEQGTQGACSEFTLIMRIDSTSERVEALNDFVADRTARYWVGRALLEVGWQAAMAGETDEAARFYERALWYLPPFYERTYRPLVNDPDKIREMRKYESEYEKYRSR